MNEWVGKRYGRFLVAYDLVNTLSEDSLKKKLEIINFIEIKGRPEIKHMIFVGESPRADIIDNDKGIPMYVVQLEGELLSVERTGWQF